MVDGSGAQGAEDLRDQLRRMLLGYQLSRCLYVAAKLQIPDLLEDGPKSADELATATGTQPAALGRFLRVLSSHGVFALDELGRFALTPLASLLGRGTARSMWAAAIYWGERWIWQSWGDLTHSLRTGAPAFDAVHGASFFDFLAQAPEAAEVFDRFIADGLYERPKAVLAAYDFSHSNVIADVGGGQGAMLAAILNANPDARGILFDRPQVIAGARTKLEDAGVIDRCSIVAGDFFKTVPSGADTYLLSQIVHDWPDEPAAAILRNCRRVMDASGRLFLIEQVMDPLRPEPATALLDLTMLAVLGGRERTAQEYAMLCTHADLRLARIIPTCSPFSIMEAVPA
jgi:ubiquinone/menaquinone biosynthesis C-methylase UbiE